MALSTRRRDRSYPTPMAPGFDDSNRERGIAQSQGIASLPSSIIPFRTSETPRENFISRTQGGNKDRDFNTSDALYNLFQKYKKDPTEQGLQLFQDSAEKFFETPPMERPILPEDFVPEFNPVGLFGPGSGLGDPTGEGGIIQRLGEMLGLIDPIDPENDGLPMDEGLPLPDDFKGGLPPGSMTETLEASADTYTLPNLLQMLNDARDAGNEEEMERYMNDLELLYPGATMSGII